MILIALGAAGVAYGITWAVDRRKRVALSWAGVTGGVSTLALLLGGVPLV